MKRFVISFYIAGLCIALCAGCGGGGGSTSSSYTHYTGGQSASQTVDEQVVTDDETRVAARRSVGVSRDVQKNMVLPDDTGMMLSRSTGRMAGRMAAAYYNNTVDADTGCTMNGYSDMTLTSSSVAEIDDDYTRTNCDDPDDNGHYVNKGALTQKTSSAYYFDVLMTVTHEGSLLSMTIPLKGTYYDSSGVFSRDGLFWVSFNGKDDAGNTYTNLRLTEVENDTDTISLSGKVKDSTGFTMTFLGGSQFKEDGSGHLVFTATGGVLVDMAMNADGSGSATLYASRDNAVLGATSWDASGSGNLIFADGGQESFSS
jgi:hypothetical protein